MGHPRKARKKYDTPPHPWNAERIKSENKLMETSIFYVYIYRPKRKEWFFE